MINIQIRYNQSNNSEHECLFIAIDISDIKVTNVGQWMRGIN